MTLRGENVGDKDRLICNDGRTRHTCVEAIVLEVGPKYMVVEFANRAAPNTIMIGDSEWMNYLRRFP